MAAFKPKPEWWEPKAWPLWARRMFVLTLPISGPLWLVSVALGHFWFVVFVLLIGLPAMAFFWLKEELWDAPQPKSDVGGSHE